MEFEIIIEADRSVVFDVFLSTNRALFREKSSLPALPAEFANSCTAYTSRCVYSRKR